MANGDFGDRIRWLVLAEALILLWAAAGPGYRHGMVPDADPGVVARVFFEDPTFLQEVAVNAAGLNIFVGGVWLMVWLLARTRSDG